MSGETIKHRIDTGLGVIGFPGQPPIVYMIDGDRIAWARHTGEPFLPLTPELSAAIWENYRRKSS